MLADLFFVMWVTFVTVSGILKELPGPFSNKSRSSTFFGLGSIKSFPLMQYVKPLGHELSLANVIRTEVEVVLRILHKIRPDSG